MSATLETPRQQRAGAGVGELELELPGTATHEPGDGGGGDGGQEPPERPPASQLGYDRPGPPRWQLVLLWAGVILASALAGLFIGQLAQIVHAGLHARAEGEQ